MINSARHPLMQIKRVLTRGLMISSASQTLSQLPTLVRGGHLGHDVVGKSERPASPHGEVLFSVSQSRWITLSDSLLGIEFGWKCKYLIEFHVSIEIPFHWQCLWWLFITRLGYFSWLKLLRIKKRVEMMALVKPPWRSSWLWICVWSTRARWKMCESKPPQSAWFLQSV